MEKIFHLVYLSTPSQSVSDKEIESIIEISRINNPKNNITGMLIFRENRFLQVLEGDEKQVRQLYDKIKNDKRHSKVKILLEARSDQRIYNNWSMAYVDSRNLKISAQSILELIEMVTQDNKYEKSLILLLLEKMLHDL